MKNHVLKRRNIPKISVLAAGLAAAVMVATITPAPGARRPAPVAQATPRAGNCAGCHGSDTGNVSTVTATPSIATPAAGATYTVAITMTANPLGGNTGYGIVAIAPTPTPLVRVFGGNSGSQLAFSATMIAPAAAGT